MEVCKFGERIDAAIDPIGATRLALRAASGCGSKASAWAWANDAVKAVSFHSEKAAEDLNRALKDSATNFPNTSAAEDVLDSISA